MRKAFLAGKSVLHKPTGTVTGQIVQLGNAECYRIEHYDRMRPFFMSVVSSADHWMFISSTGGLTAGRGNPDLALFPYNTDDKIHDSAETTGSKTILLVNQGGQTHLWEPFSDRYSGVYRIQRNLYKNAWGNLLVFEECNFDLGLTFRYAWSNSPQFGFVREALLQNTSKKRVTVRLLDGIQNLMPCGVGSQFQNDKSTLLDAYKRAEWMAESGLAIFRLSSIPIDRPEPAEALRATTVWSVGLPKGQQLLSSSQLDRFRTTGAVKEETDVRGQRGAFFRCVNLVLSGGQSMEWTLVADVGRGPSDIAALRNLLRRPGHLWKEVRADVELGARELRRIIACGDGCQKTQTTLGDWRHANNVLFNVMRGGFFPQGYLIDPADLRSFVQQANREVAERAAPFFKRLKGKIHYSSLLSMAKDQPDRQLERICREYLPLGFSRRHGDPSRPWNRFSIPTRKPDGSWVLNYEGNWRDIFQNWEALAASYPAYLPGMICRFVSASTADGYNPYRITRNGIDWEVVNPSDPWAHIGYWGDHQLIYLLKLLESLRQHDPAELQSMLTRDLFAYANVPYRIHPYEKLLEDPKETVDFDSKAEELVVQRVAKRGGDGRLLWDEKDEVLQVNLSEKMLVSVLAKLANFIPEAGIWLNTQRPEWNDANNALVGNGVSMVTLCYLRRYLSFCHEIFETLQDTPIAISAEVCQLLKEVATALEKHQGLLQGPIEDQDRKRVLDDLGGAGSQYRDRLYRQSLSGDRQSVDVPQLLAFCRLALQWIDHSIQANRRADGLYHSYNLVSFDQGDRLPIRRLYEMLEGQVAVLSSGCLDAREAVQLIDSLKQSAMYRADQHSYLLYPNRELPRFCDRNNIPAKDIKQSALLRKLIADGERSLVEQDCLGVCHFSGHLTNGGDVVQALGRLESIGYAQLVERDRARVLALFERLFDHQSFTGRSGTFFAYEGLGSIYWHMVSKLLLAVQESYERAASCGDHPPSILALARAYYDIRSGLGDAKTPDVYGGFPMDPYSHTPAHTGARQPGLTGQVKEDILCRFGELGVWVWNGQITFAPSILRHQELLRESGLFRYFDLSGTERSIRVPAHGLAFTYCQVPVVYKVARDVGLVVRYADGTEDCIPGLRLDAATSQAIFERTGIVAAIQVNVPRG